MDHAKIWKNTIEKYREQTGKIKIAPGDQNWADWHQISSRTLQ